MCKRRTSANERGGGNEEADSMGTRTGPFLPAEDYRQLFGRHPDTWSCYQVAANGALRGL